MLIVVFYVVHYYGHCVLLINIELFEIINSIVSFSIFGFINALFKHVFFCQMRYITDVFLHVLMSFFSLFIYFLFECDHCKYVV